MNNKPGLLLVANWDSDVGYAWWLIEGFWAKIAEHLGQRYQIYLAYPSISKVPSVIQAAPIELVEYNCKDFSPRNISSHLSWLRKHRIEVIYFTDRPFISPYYPLFRMAGVKHIISHDHTPGERSPSRGWKKLVKILLARSPASVDLAMVTTDYLRQRAMATACIPEHKCKVAANGIAPVQVNRQLSREELGLPLEGRLIVTAARANYYKGIDFAIELFAQVAELHPDCYYLVLGDGPHLDDFKDQAKELSLAERVIFKGRVEGVANYLQHCQIAVHPSKGEVGYCLAILEYMQAGLPVMVPNNPAVCGATRDGVDGLRYQQGDLRDARSKLLRYLDTPDLAREHGLQARQQITQQFSLEQTHNSLLQALRQHL
ncbi:glycosyltransferase family 4 protein [Aliagarivorans marinus]|uniref:glycosyltransferase family 4 protein n=1 Tax=Aliagarivorans marinus TaxID=561965 RepID=UPI00040E0848|nr:glycosyltransferase family 4 protein [Aliagarivorans marinus]